MYIYNVTLLKTLGFSQRGKKCALEKRQHLHQMVLIKVGNYI